MRRLALSGGHAPIAVGSDALTEQAPNRVVNGPGLVERTRQSRDAHLAPYRDDHDWTFEFGPWVNPHDEPAA